MEGWRGPGLERLPRRVTLKKHRSLYLSLASLPAYRSLPVCCRHLDSRVDIYAQRYIRYIRGRVASCTGETRIGGEVRRSGMR